jgi:hypothetical protein
MRCDAMRCDAMRCDAMQAAAAARLARVAQSRRERAAPNAAVLPDVIAEADAAVAQRMSRREKSPPIPDPGAHRRTHARTIAARAHMHAHRHLARARTRSVQYARTDPVFACLALLRYLRDARTCRSVPWHGAGPAWSPGWGRPVSLSIGIAALREALLFAAAAAGPPVRRPSAGRS